MNRSVFGYIAAVLFVDRYYFAVSLPCYCHMKKTSTSSYHRCIKLIIES